MSTLIEPANAQRMSLVVRRIASRRVGVALIVLSTLVFVVVNCVRLAEPGLEYDELLFVNGALGAPHAYHDFIYREAFGVPTMLMPYIGALKAWIYAPIFAVFGVSVDSIRVPAVLLAAVTLLMAAWLARRLLGLWPAVALSVLLASDPAFGPMARTDWGPIVLSGLLRIAALLCYFAFIRRGSIRYVWLLVLALTLGLFNKLDFAWFIAALAVAAAVVYHGELLDALRRRRAALVAPILVMFGVAVAAYFALIVPANELPTPAPSLSLSARISVVQKLFRSTFDGASVYENMTGLPLPHATLIGSLFPGILLAGVVVTCWLAVWGRRSPYAQLRDAAKLTAFFLILFVVLAVGIVVTRQATGPWHVMLLWPLPDLLALCLLVFATRIPPTRLRALATSVAAVGLAALLVTQLRTSSEYERAYRDYHGWTSPWSAETYAAARAVSRSAQNVQSVVSADWGLGTELYALGSETMRARFIDGWSVFTNSPETLATLEQGWLGGQGVIVVFHSRPSQIMPSTTERAEALVTSGGSRARRIYAGRQIEAVELRARTAESPRTTLGAADGRAYAAGLAPRGSHPSR
jgi:4-amino-4-deoxy-L-arabinose transferase-like glycosyltransferase